MQSARIWFRQTRSPVTLSAVEALLASLGATVEKTEWKLGTFVVPQLRVIQPAPFLIQLNDGEYVVEEAEEFAEFDNVPREIKAKLLASDTRLEVGDVSENSVISETGVTVFEGWTSFDPSQPKTLHLLRQLTAEFRGILEDNVNGSWWSL